MTRRRHRDLAFAPSVAARYAPPDAAPTCGARASEATGTRRVTPSIAGLLFCSGAAGLAYEVLWARDWGLVYGTTAAGAAVVLAAYFAGLALGAPLGARLARGRNGLAVYAALELGIAIAVLGYVALRPGLATLAIGLATAGVPPALLPLVRSAIAFAVLGLPTVLLGATLPAVAAVLPRGDVAGASRLYAWNTLGGAVGAAATGFAGIGWLGLRGSFLAAVALNAIVAGLALGLARRAPRAAAVPRDAGRTGPAAPLPLRPAALAAVVGFAALAAQVLWTRGVAGVLSNSLYSVTLVLTASLLGIVAGAALAGRRLRRDAVPPVGSALAAAAAAIALSRIVLETVPSLSLALIVRLGVTSAAAGLAVEALLVLAVVLVPTTAVATLLPLLLAHAGRDEPSRALGRLLAANTAGGIAGALAGAFVILPRLGLGGGLAAVAACLLAATGLAGKVAWAPTAAAAAAVALVGLRGPLALPWRAPPGDRVLFYRDGAAATVTVTADARGAKRLRVNGQYSLGGTSGLLLEAREAHVPLLLHPAPTRLLHLGVGTGDTIGAASVHPGLAIDGVELVPEVLEAAALFAPENRDVLRRPGVRLVPDDARSFLLGTGATWDVIVSDLFLPWAAGAASLYSLDFYRLGLAHLGAGGLYCQWLPLHQLAVGDLAAIVATFTAAFPHADLWLAYHRNTTPLAALIGSPAPLAPDGDTIRRRLAAPDVREAAGGVGIVEPLDLAVLWVGDGATLRRATAAAVRITDDRPALERSAPAAYFHQERLAPAALEWIAGALAPGDGPIRGAPARVDLRRALLDAQRALLRGDRPAELRAYLDAFALAPDLPTTRHALAAIARERRAAGDVATAAGIEGVLD
jgi:spermidine synthase